MGRMDEPDFYEVGDFVIAQPVLEIENQWFAGQDVCAVGVVWTDKIGVFEGDEGGVEGVFMIGGRRGL
jgi:hypothetical protein